MPGQLNAPIHEGGRSRLVLVLCSTQGGVLIAKFDLQDPTSVKDSGS